MVGEPDAVVALLWDASNEALLPLPAFAACCSCCLSSPLSKSTRCDRRVALVAADVLTVCQFVQLVF